MDKKEKKNLTIDDLARMMQANLASKEDIGHLEAKFSEKLRDTERVFLRSIEGVELKISTYASRWTQDFDNLRDWVRDLENRLQVVEGKRTDKTN